MRSLIDSTKTVSNSILKKIQLTETESSIREILLQVVEQLHQKFPLEPKINLRIAGGWVRDKLMGKQSNDIDIAVDTMTGEPFALAVKEFMDSKHHKTSKVSKIQVNPEKSKHLETATVRLLGLDVDFVNLRSETYNGDSRNPTIEFGTPLEDALRRDITINSLFFNLHTMEVEDFTGRGLNDLQQHRIETPLPPLETFTDDPLRILRVIRFATRFDYQVADDIYEATKNEAIVHALETKLSRERIGAEMHKMLTGENPLRAIELLCEFNCYHSTFTTPPEVPYSKADVEKCLKISRILNELLSNGSLNDIAWLSDLSNKETVGQLYLATSISPYGNSHFKQKINANSQLKQIQTSKYIIGFSLKLSVSQSDFVAGLLSHADKISELVLQNYSSEFNRKSTGLLIRELGQRPIGHNWDLCILISLVLDIFKLNIFVDKSEKEFQFVLDRYTKFMKDVFLHQLQNAYELKPILDGKKVAKLLDIKPGPKVGVILQQLIEWQLLNGDVKEEEAIFWLKRHFQE